MEIKIKDKMTCKSQKEGRNEEEGEGEKDLLVINLPKHVQNFYAESTNDAERVSGRHC